MEPGVTLSMTKAVSVSMSRPERGVSLCSRARDDAESKTPGVSKFLDWDASFVDLPRCFYRRDLGLDQHDPPLRARWTRQEDHRPNAFRSLEDDDFSGRVAL